MVSINDFGVVFGKTRILENINFEVNAGEIVTILGASGCGKTTILRAIAGLQEEHEGEVCVGNRCVSSKDVFVRDRQIGYIFQDYALFPHINVEENIAFALDKLPKEQKDKRVHALLEQFDIKEHQKKSIHQLSGGQQQRVAIARAMANNPKILLLDEPFANLDAQLRQKTKMWLKNLIKECNLSAILVTHDKKEALSISDKIGIIHDKKMLQFDTTKNIFEKPKSYYVANFLSEINILPNELLENFNLKLEAQQVTIIEISKCCLTQTPNNFEVNILDESFCGEEYEILCSFKNYETKNNLMIKSNKAMNKEESYYLDIKKNDVKIISK